MSMESQPIDSEQRDAAVTTRTTGAGLDLVLHGQMNISAACEVHQASLRCLDLAGDVRVDCSQVEHLSAAILQVLLTFQDGLREKGRNLVLNGVPPAVHHYLRLAGVDGLFQTAAAVVVGCEPSVNTPAEN